MSTALIVVDVQNDFVEGGALAVEGGKALATKLSQIVTDGDFRKTFKYLITTQDYHVEPIGHFSDNPDYVSTWPAHCVAKTKGADFADPLGEALKFAKIDATIRKGDYSAAYSGFEGKDRNGFSLADVLRAMKVDKVVICGIATDYCVKETAFDSVKHGFDTYVWGDMTVGINEENVKNLFESGFSEAGVKVI